MSYNHRGLNYENGLCGHLAAEEEELRTATRRDKAKNAEIAHETDQLFRELLEVAEDSKQHAMAKSAELDHQSRLEEVETAAGNVESTMNTNPQDHSGMEEALKNAVEEAVLDLTRECVRSRDEVGALFWRTAAEMSGEISDACFRLLVQKLALENTSSNESL